MIMSENDDDFGVSSVPELHKIQATIPQRLYLELQNRGLFSDCWDSWLASAILMKLREKTNMED